MIIKRVAFIFSVFLPLSFVLAQQLSPDFSRTVEEIEVVLEPEIITVTLESAVPILTFKPILPVEQPPQFGFEPVVPTLTFRPVLLEEKELLAPRFGEFEEPIVQMIEVVLNLIQPQEQFIEIVLELEKPKEILPPPVVVTRPPKEEYSLTVFYVNQSGEPTLVNPHALKIVAKCIPECQVIDRLTGDVLISVKTEAVLNLVLIEIPAAIQPLIQTKQGGFLAPSGGSVQSYGRGPLSAGSGGGFGPAASIAAPSNLSALVTCGANKRVDLSWTNNNLGLAIEIERSINSGAFVLITTVSAGTTSYADTGLSTTATHDYRIRSNSPYSSTVTTAAC